MIYLGRALLNGPSGASDTPEVFVPIEYHSGVTTEYVLVIQANSSQEAQEKQILWHCIRDRHYKLSKLKAHIDILKKLDNLSNRVL